MPGTGMRTAGHRLYDMTPDIASWEMNVERRPDRGSQTHPSILRLTPSRWNSSGMTVFGVELGGGK